MELAIPAPSLQAAQSLILEDSKPRVSVFSRRIIRIEPAISGLEKDYVHENTFFTIVTLKQTCNLIEKENDGSIDAILVNPDQVTDEVSKLKELTRARAIPVFIYTPKFDQSAKQKALTLGA